VKDLFGNDRMQQQYEYIHFDQVQSSNKTGVYACRNNRSGGGIGTVRWYGAWRQYCFFTGVEAIFSAGCLRDIMDFLTQLNGRHH
jgi:hypothetical protein